MSKGASLAPQEIKMLFAVLPVTFCKGLFNHIHKKFTFEGKKRARNLFFRFPAYNFVCF